MNSKFITRLLYYLTGFGIGILMVMVLFQNRACNWTPKNKIKQDLANRVVVVNEEFKLEAEKRGVTKEMIIQVFKEGSVDFSSSQKHDEPKAYNLYTKDLRLNFTIPVRSYISEVSVGFDDSKKIQNTTTGMGDLYIFPDKENLLFVDSATTLSATYRELGRPKNATIVKALKKNGKIDFEKSNFNLRPDASHYLICELNGQKIGMKTVWYQEKIIVYSIDLL